jgi:hypothetical protein
MQNKRFLELEGRYEMTILLTSSSTKYLIRYQKIEGERNGQTQFRKEYMITKTLIKLGSPSRYSTFKIIRLVN